MTTVTDLREELHALADLAPSDEDVRRTLADRIAGHAKHRRTTALIATAAAVVLVAGGAGIAGAVLSHRSAGPAGPTPVVSVPEVPLPPDTKLIRHALRAVTTPVTATPPRGLTGQVWFSAPGRLAVSWFDPAAAGDSAFGWTLSAPDESTSGGPSAAGYVLTDARDEAVTTVGPNGRTAVTPSERGITVGGHPATLQTAPEGTNDSFGFPAAERISWQLSDGRWIHVWSTAPTRESSPSRTLMEFAATVTETPQTLNRSVGIGLTLPGLTVDSSINSAPLATITGASVYLCPAGVDPLVASSGSSSGTGSAGPDGTTSTETETDPTAECETAAVVNYPGEALSSGSGPTSTMTVGDTVAHVDTNLGAAWADLGGGLTAIAGAPKSAHLSKQDLAALVASVRLSPAVTVLPLAATVVASAQAPVARSGSGGPQTSAATSGRAAASSSLASAVQIPIPSPLPTATTTLPDANSAVDVPPLPDRLPLSFSPTERGWYSSWAVNADGAIGEATVMLHGDNADGGFLRWQRGGLTGVPADAAELTVAGHRAQLWHESTAAGTVTHIGWTLPDGSGLQVLGGGAFGGSGAGDADQLAAFAALITDGSLPVPASTWTPRRSVGDLTQVQALVAIGSAGSSTNATTSESTGSSETAGTWLCPADTPLDHGGPPIGSCLDVFTGPDAGGFRTLDADATVAMVDGTPVYVSADGRALSRIMPSDLVVTVAAEDGTITMTPADLAAILLSIPG